ncbi:hypothetical protein FA09DRAFT_240113 [Tilletiopsis washingtonensis]|jgi:hypothetical protein|uniref:Uncharacterized protein n=1 Tax=Tilletiopsis washingtonensis TaxID=58919 RepID=A0A316ZDR5_9BASI|nr:hypothetical protein FA09DRAFT_240113 [Tilletiopsis washingtonensis]PWN99052.1 hypothetical protein FA09DRAFT_240113 [Tilletiopsis washingtonensis]
MLAGTLQQGVYDVNASALIYAALSFGAWLVLPKALRVPFEPRQILFSSPPEFAAALLGPVLPAGSFLTAVTRIVQLALLALIVIPRAPLLLAPWTVYALWILTVTLRSFLALASVALGWKVPFFFSHPAVYEATAGLGPVLVAIDVATFLQLRLPNDPSPVPSAASTPLAGSNRVVALHAGVAGLLCLIEGAPWSYACGAVVGAIFGVLNVLASRFQLQGKYSLLGSADNAQPQASDDEAATSSRHQRTPSIIAPPGARKSTKIVLSRLLAHLAAFCVVSIFTADRLALRPKLADVGPTTTAGRPLLDIVLLTAPRPRGSDISSDLLQRTVASYFDIIPTESVLPSPPRLSVFTHFTEKEHPAFDRVAAHYEHITRPLGNRSSSVVFYRDQDQHPADHVRHHLHLAELLRWSHQRKDASEWTLVVEDDYALCGKWGWRGMEAVVATLEQDRKTSAHLRLSAESKHQTPPDETPLAGWIGAGGSGLILHRSMLPLAQRLLSLYTTGNDLRQLTPANAVLLQCLTGESECCQAAVSNAAR